MTAHENEIRTSHAQGFGGSDARLFLRILYKGVEHLSMTDNKRIATALGAYNDDTQLTETPQMIAGRAWEEETANELDMIKKPYWREYKLQSHMADNFQVFAHADFFIPAREHVIECKATTCKTWEQLIRSYMPQLQWYYLFADVKGVSINMRSEIQGEKILFIHKNEELIQQLQQGIKVLDDAITNGWRPALPTFDNFIN